MLCVIFYNVLQKGQIIIWTDKDVGKGKDFYTDSETVNLHRCFRK